MFIWLKKTHKTRPTFAEKHETQSDAAPTIPDLSEREILQASCVLIQLSQQLNMCLYECEEWEGRKVILGATLHQIAPPITPVMIKAKDGSPRERTALWRLWSGAAVQITLTYLAAIVTLFQQKVQRSVCVCVCTRACACVLTEVLSVAFCASVQKLTFHPLV